jgi:glutamyl-tRNA reductase
MGAADDRAAPTITALVAHARDVPSDARTRIERLASPLIGTGLLLATCHRTEVYVSGPPGPELLAVAAHGARRLDGPAATRHLLRVAVGLDSVVLGEDQVLHQLRMAVDHARSRGLDPRIGRLAVTALRAGRIARSWQTGPRRSIADVAVARLGSMAPGSVSPVVLVVGAGTMGRLAVRAVQRVGGRPVLHSRTPDHAAAVAIELGAETDIPDDARIGGVVVALAGPWHVTRSLADRLAGDDPTIVDLSAPPAVPRSLRRRLRRVIDLDSLGPDPAAAMDLRSAARLETLAERTAAEVDAWLADERRRSAARTLAGRVEATRRSSLEHLFHDHPEVEPEVRAAIDRMTADLAARLLREPFSRLREDRDGQGERLVQEVFGL